MSKKLAEGCDVLVLDVKTGNGAFMAELEDARELAQAMIAAGQAMGRRVAAHLTDMSQPLGVAIGNANEVAEAITALRGEGCPADLWLVTRELTATMLRLAGLETNDHDASARVDRALEDGSALAVLCRMIEAQGGDPRIADDLARLPTAPQREEILAPRAGWLNAVACREIGLAAVELGAGRATMEEAVDHGVGLSWLARLGEPVEAGQPLFAVQWRDPERWQRARVRLQNAITIADEPIAPPPLFRERLG
jgi:thymidine phosphorylase